MFRFFKIYIGNSAVYYNLNEGIKNTLRLSNAQNSCKFVTLFEVAKLFLFDKFGNSNVCQKFQNLRSPLFTRPDELISVAPDFEGMKSLRKRILGVVSKIKKKKKKKSSRKKKSLKKLRRMTSTNERVQCSEATSTSASGSDTAAQNPPSNTNSSPATTSISYRDVLVNQDTSLVNEDTSVLNSKDEIAMRENFKSIRYDILTDYGRWITKGWLDKRATEGTRIKVLSYNILSQYLLETHSYLYSENEKKYLKWEYRSQALIQEITEFDADILCLQEVEACKLNFFNAELALRGYKGAYKKRTGDKEDGCAIYYQESKFNLKEMVPIEYYQPGVSVLDRDNIGLIVRLSLKDDPDKNIIVATTHLLFNPRRQDIRLAQMQVMLAEIERVAFKRSVNGCGACEYHPIILTGDFNSRPFSPVYNLLMNGGVYLDGLNPMPPYLGITAHCQHAEVKRNRNAESREDSDVKRVQLFHTERENLTQKRLDGEKLSWRRRADDYDYRTDYLCHNLNLNSVHPYGYGHSEDASTFQITWCTVDFIFYGPGRFFGNQKVDGDMKLMSYLKLPKKDESYDMKRIPNAVCASDHFPLLATFHLPRKIQSD